MAGLNLHKNQQRTDTKSIHVGERAVDAEIEIMIEIERDDRDRDRDGDRDNTAVRAESKRT